MPVVQDLFRPLFHCDILTRDALLGDIGACQSEGIAWEVRQATLRTNNTGTACKGITCGGR